MDPKRLFLTVDNDGPPMFPIVGRFYFETCNAAE
jgi:hypothetical protein